jgi:trk system potassium uptake protein TrkH
VNESTRIDSWLTAHPVLGGARRVAYLLSSLVLFTSATLVVPLAVSIVYDESRSTTAFVYSIIIGVVVGLAGQLLFRTDLGELTRREGFAVVGLGWSLACLLGALPFALSGTLGFMDAWFESASGFTGTGASTITDIEAVERGVLFWRSFTHWLGGMGFVVLYIALFPLLGVGAMQLYKAETPGPDKDRITPRIRQTAKILWLIYLGISVVLTLLLLVGGLDLFDALCQMFATLGTGGFSTLNVSVGGFGNPFVEWVLVIFMWIAATNFALHYAVLIGKPRRMLRNPEWRFFTGMLLICAVIVGPALLLTADEPASQSVRDAFFTVASIGSTTGFVTADYETWIPFLQLLLFLLMFIGGCAGSTAGAMKCVRVQVLFKQSLKEFFRVVHPHAVNPPRLGDKTVSASAVRRVLAFIALYLMTCVVATLGLSLTGLDFETSVSSVVACIGNIGPGLGDVGPFDNYGFIHPAGKAVLSLCMLIGRLELFSILLLFAPAYWRR